MLQSFLKLLLRTLVKPALGPGVAVYAQRSWLKAVAAGMAAPRGTQRSLLSMQGVAAERVEALDSDTQKLVLYFHGGGYCVGSAHACRAITGRLARQTRAIVYAPDYRLAPEHPHPAALDDALACYRWLLTQGHTASSIAFSGDSAGAGLALATALSARDVGLPLPSALALISPWTDLSCNSVSFKTHAARDPLLSAAILRRWAQAYLGALPSQHPACSPLYADLKGLPPMLIQVGSEEVLLQDARQLHQRAQIAGVNAKLHAYEGMWHDFQLHAGMLGASDAAVSEIGDFLLQHWHAPQP